MSITCFAVLAQCPLNTGMWRTNGPTDRRSCFTEKKLRIRTRDNNYQTTRYRPSSFFCWSERFLSTAIIPFDVLLCRLMNSSSTSIAYRPTNTDTEFYSTQRLSGRTAE